MAELAGVLVGDYFLLECLAREGIVETYRARPIMRGGYDVILRLFRPQFPDLTSFREHFATEVEKVWRCHHEHLQPLLEFGTGDDLLYTATLISDAETVEQFLGRQRERPLPISFAVQIVTHLCAAVQYAHEQGIVHGNIQPSSILMRAEEDVLLTNFGMKRAYQHGESLVAQIEEGNPTYTAPEQALGMVCPASDIYALGVLLYRLLGGSLPYDDDDAGKIALKHTDEPIPSLRTLRPELSEELDLVVRVALSKSPEARFPDAAALAQALQAAVLSKSLQIISALPERRIIVQARRTSFTWSRAMSLLTTVLLLFALIATSFFVVSFPQLGGRPFWNSGPLGAPGHTPATVPVTPPSLTATPTLSGTRSTGTHPSLHPTPTQGPPQTLVNRLFVDYCSFFSRYLTNQSRAAPLAILNPAPV